MTSNTNCLDRIRRHAAWFLLLALLLPPGTALANLASEDPDAAFKAQLTRFFVELGSAGGDSADPAKLRSEIEGLSPETLSQMQNLLTRVPGWQQAPGSILQAMPSDLLARIETLGQSASRQAAELDRFRRELRVWFVGARLLPDRVLAELNQDRVTLEVQQKALAGLPPSSLAALQGNLDPGWLASQTRAFAALPPEVVHGVRQLASRGPLDSQEVEELVTYRQELEALLGSGISSDLDPQSLVSARATLSEASPEMLWVLRQQIDTPETRKAMRDARLLAAFDSIDANDKRALKQFRREFGAALARHDSLEHYARQLATLSDRDLYVTREKIRQIPAWRHLPLIMARASAVEQDEQVRQLREGRLSADKLAELEQFRSGLVSWLDAMGSDDALVARVETLGPRELLLTRAVYEEVPADEIPEVLAAIASMNELEDDDPIVSPVLLGDCPTLVPDAVCDFVDNAIDAVISPINSAISTINSALSSIGETLRDFFVGLFEAAVGVFSADNIASLFGMVGDWWNDLPLIPAVPCPAIDTDLGPFGVVGDRQAAITFHRNVWVVNELIKLVPETEMSTGLKITLKLIWAGVQYMDLCLTTAADQVAREALVAYRASVFDNFDEVDARLAMLGNDVATLQVTVDGSTDQINMRITESVDLMTRLAIESNLLRSGQDRIGRFQLPQAYGGQLELVRQIVAETVTMNEAAGESVACAVDDLDRGDQAFDADEFKQAYFWFRKAYQQAVRDGGCNGPDPNGTP